MTIPREEVEHVARLAHVGLDVAEVEELASELSTVLDHVKKLSEVDVTGVPPTSHVFPVHDVTRDDVVTPSWSPADVLANAPRHHSGQFLVQAILD